MARGTALKGALATTPKGLQRVSPGIYRNPQGNLVGSRGQALPGSRQQPTQRPSTQVVRPGLSREAAGQAENILRDGRNQPPPSYGSPMPMLQQGEQPSWRQPSPYEMQPGMVYQGGSANFNEETGRYMEQPFVRSPKQFQEGASFARQPAMNMPYKPPMQPQQFQQMQQQFQQMQQQPQQQPMQQPPMPPTGQYNR